MNDRVERLDQAESWILEDGRVWWVSDRLDLTVDLVTEDQGLTLWADPINTMREVGIALVDHTGTMRSNTRRDRRHTHE